MGKIRQEETVLIQKIKDYKLEQIATFKEEFLLQKEERLKKGEVFYDGMWVPINKLKHIRRKLFFNRFKLFFEIHIVLFFIVFIIYFVWVVFKRFMLP